MLTTGSTLALALELRETSKHVIAGIHSALVSQRTARNELLKRLVIVKRNLELDALRGVAGDLDELNELRTAWQRATNLVDVLDQALALATGTVRHG